VKNYVGINYAFRPDSYWEEGDLLHSILRYVKGRNRKHLDM